MIEAHRTRRRARLPAHLSAALAAMAVASAPSAPAAAAPVRKPAEIEAEAANVLTLKFAVVEAITPVEEAGEAGPEPMMAPMTASGSEVVSHAGVALSFEHALWAGGLAAEVNVVFLPEEHGLTLPSELLLKKVFALSPVAEPFVGLGFAAEWLLAGEYEPQYGLASDLGAYFWLERHLGLVVETEYSLFLSRELEHEIAIAAGGALRF